MLGFYTLIFMAFVPFQFSHILYTISELRKDKIKYFENLMNLIPPLDLFKVIRILKITTEIF
ncbi:hypothetical protein LPTSP2_01240 [Leptospira ellinghausenii]|uniref:Uncharacterized protein n=1 Tax=Leptospira ellinghausenii TaxID=1917822 RepID=A0A2P2D8C0_9LEPT|nr:hypothetical protein LPTSP2_01240 [Leptospira ellinghausenii]